MQVSDMEDSCPDEHTVEVVGTMFQQLPDLVFQQLFTYLSLKSCLLLTACSNTLYNLKYNLSKSRIVLIQAATTNRVRVVTAQLKGRNLTSLECKLLNQLIQSNNLLCTITYVQEFGVSESIDNYVSFKHKFSGHDAILYLLEQYVLLYHISSDSVCSHICSYISNKCPEISKFQRLRYLHLYFHMYSDAYDKNISKEEIVLEIEVRKYTKLWDSDYMHSKHHTDKVGYFPLLYGKSTKGYSTERLGYLMHFEFTELALAYEWYNDTVEKNKYPKTVLPFCEDRDGFSRCFRCYPPCDDEEKVLDMYRNALEEVD